MPLNNMKGEGGFPMNQGACINRSCEIVSSHSELDRNTRVRFYERVMQWKQRARSRRYLRDMPSYLLKDIGIDEPQRQEEIRKPFWR
ncbi:DUF1127 domain-containing protein [Aestuariirhabdus haliotis]|uniref:DUF1127 domain-containing protein n=1 Tax=Aestuariirhabdus haliotis TaxID=2918751 RepID=UPI0038737C4C